MARSFFLLMQPYVYSAPAKGSMDFLSANSFGSCSEARRVITPGAESRTGLAESDLLCSVAKLRGPVRTRRHGHVQRFRCDFVFAAGAECVQRPHVHAFIVP